MAQGQPEEAWELEGVLDEAEVVAEGAAVDSEQVVNAYAPIVAIGAPTRQVPPAMKLSALNVDHQ
jgi:hypothetical protein